MVSTNSTQRQTAAGSFSQSCSSSNHLQGDFTFLQLQLQSLEISGVSGVKKTDKPIMLKD